MKRFLAWVLALAAVLSVAPASRIAPRKAAAEAAVHDHTSAEWTPWDGIAALENGKKYYLTEDISPAATTIQRNWDVTICLCGHSMTARSNSRLFRLAADSALTVTDCQATFDGEGNLTSENKLVPNKASGGVIYFSPLGGEIPTKPSVATLHNVVIDGAGITGANSGAIHMGNKNSKLVLRNCVIRNCTTGAANQAAAISLSSGGTVDAQNVLFSANRSTAPNGRGGAINVSGNILAEGVRLQNCRFEKNTGAADGGAIWANSGITTVINCAFTDNQAAAAGGAVYSGGGQVHITGATFTDNTAGTNGAAVIFKGSGSLTDCTVTGNTAAGRGAVFSTPGSGGVVTIAGATKITGNTAADNRQADLYIDGATTVTLQQLVATTDVNVATATDKAVSAFLVADTGLREGLQGVYYQNTQMQVSFDGNRFLPVEIRHMPHYACTCAFGVVGCDHSADGPVAWTAWDSATTLPVSGTYCLTKDVKLTEPAAVTGSLTLCLHGCNIDLNGYGIDNSAELTILNCKAIVNDKQQLQAAETGKIVNGFGGYGGAIKSTAGDITLMGICFAHNTGKGSDTRTGGAIYTEAGLLTVESCRFVNNYADTDNPNPNRGIGGAINIYGNACAVIADTVFESNTARLWGGAIAAVNTGATQDTDLILKGNTRITGCATQSDLGDGSAILLYNESTDHRLNVTLGGNTQITGNTAARNGAVYVKHKSGSKAIGLTVTENVQITGNTGIGQIGDLYISDLSDKLTVGQLGNRAKVDFSTAEDIDDPDRVLITTVPQPETKDTKLNDTGSEPDRPVGYSIAEGFYFVGAPKPLPPHVHHACICAMGSAGCYHGSSQPTPWTAWDAAAGADFATTLPVSGVYYLTSDVTLAANVTLTDEVKLCLNGFSINLNGNTIANSGSLTVINCKATLNEKKQLTNEDGKLYGGKTNGTDALYHCGGAIGTEGTVDLIGVNVTDNLGLGSDVRAAGALYAQAGFVRIQSCKFSNNIADTNIATDLRRGVGGAICLNDDASMVITDTVFAGNCARYQGGAIATYNKDATQDTTLVIGGNTVFTNNQTLNTESGYGSALYLYNRSENYSLQVTIGGNTQITENTAAGFGAVAVRKYNAFCAPARVTVTESVAIFNNRAKETEKSDIYIADTLGTRLTVGALSGGAKLTVSNLYPVTDPDELLTVKDDYVMPDTANSRIVYGLNGKTVAYSREKAFYFHSDLPSHAHHACACAFGADGCGHAADPAIQWEPWESTTGLPSVSGNYYLLDHVDLTGMGAAIELLDGVDIKLCLNGKNITGDSANVLNTNYYVRTGASLTILNCKAKLDSKGIPDPSAGGGRISGCHSKKGGFLMSHGALQVMGVTFDGNTAQPDATGQGGGAILVQRGDADIRYCRFTGNRSTETGGAIALYGTETKAARLNVENCFFTNNAARNCGGAIGVYTHQRNGEGCAMTVKNTVFQENTADSGGALWVNGHKDMQTQLQLTECSFQENSAVQGGVLRVAYGDLVAEGLGMEKNRAETGGCCDLRQGNYRFTDSKFHGNSAETAGGAIGLGRSGRLELNKCSFAENQVLKNDGGAVAVIHDSSETESDGVPTLTVNDSDFTGNYAAKNGGAISVKNGLLVFNSGKVFSNRADTAGGGIAVWAAKGVCKLNGGSIVGNEAKNGGGMDIGQNAMLYHYGGDVANNHAAADGAGVSLRKQAQGHFYGGSYTHNTADGSGGGIHAQNAKVCLYGVAISANKAATRGGGVCMGDFGGYLRMEGGLVDRNQAGLAGGGIALFCNADIKGGKISDNRVYGESKHNRAFMGGGIAVYEGASADKQKPIDLNISGGEISGNYTPQYGGGIYINGRTKLTITGGAVKNNIAGQWGGGIMLDNRENAEAFSVQLYMVGGEISGNSAVGGGGIYARRCAELDVSGGLFTGNAASATGGGIYLTKGVRADLKNGQVTNNKAAKGAGLYLVENTTLENMTFTENDAGEGYTVYLDRGDYDKGMIRISGDMVITGNHGNKANMFIGKDVRVHVGSAGLGKNTRMEIDLETGLLTDTLLGAYNYEGGNLRYVVTYGNRSLTDPESLQMPETPEQQTRPVQGSAMPADRKSGLGVGFVIAVSGVLMAVVVGLPTILFVWKKTEETGEETSRK